MLPDFVPSSGRSLICKYCSKGTREETEESWSWHQGAATFVQHHANAAAETSRRALAWPGMLATSGWITIHNACVPVGPVLRWISSAHVCGNLTGHTRVGPAFKSVGFELIVTSQVATACALSQPAEKSTPFTCSRWGSGLFVVKWTLLCASFVSPKGRFDSINHDPPRFRRQDAYCSFLR
jgi:hypothetical protein